MKNELLLAEKIYLLSINIDKGGITANMVLAYDKLKTSALLMDLYLNGNIEFKHGKVIPREAKTNEQSLQYILSKLGNNKKDLASWFKKIDFESKKINRRINASLVHKGLISVENKKFLFFCRKKPKILRIKRVKELYSQVSTLMGKKPESISDFFLLSLINTNRMMKKLYADKEERKIISNKISSLLSHDYPIVMKEDTVLFKNKLLENLKNV